MKRWTTRLRQALIWLGESEYPIWNRSVRAAHPGEVELTDNAVRVVFRELVEREWGRDAVPR